MKNKSFFIFCCSLLLLVAVSYSQTVNFPYPMRKNYGNSTINATSSTASANLKAKFQNFMDQFYVEGTCSNKRNGTCARIKFGAPGNPTETVSEGIGYGMLLMVYFSENSPGKSYQSEFDKLWMYYQNWTNNNGLMNWKIQHGNANANFTGGNVTGSNAATDAEYDAALALIMAHYQFGSSLSKNYLDTARALITKIWQHEHNSDGLHKPGDEWEADRNPSYVAPAAYELFKDLGTALNWTTALTRNYTFLKNNQNQSTTTGLPSGWANPDGTTKVCSNNCGITTIAYDQDAVRAPWRWAKANAWFGHADAKTLLTKLASWVSTKNASDVKGPIQLNGTWGTNGNSSYVGSLACALTVSNTYQSNLNSYWNVLNGIENEPYFNQAMRLLTGLLITGNMPNLKACSNAGTGCGTNMNSGGGFNGTSTSIDKFAFAASEDPDDRGLAATWEPWYAYTDKESSGTSTLTNATFETEDENDNCKKITSYRVVMEDVAGGGDWVAKIPSYTLVKGGNEYAPYVALGLNARNNGTGTGKTYNFANCTGGFSYKYKGQGHNFKVQTTDVPSTSGADYFTAVSAKSLTSWTEITVSFDDIAQPTWASTAQKVDFKPANIYAFAWELKGTDAGAAGISDLTGNLAIKDFKCLGNLTLPTSRPEPKCGISDGGKPGSSSSGDGTSSSSGGTPVLISQIVQSNALITMQNAVNIQTTDNVTLQIFDLKGNAVRTLKFAQGNYIVQMADLPRGLYIVKAKNRSWNHTITIPVK